MTVWLLIGLVAGFALFFGLLALGLMQRKPVYLIIATSSLIVGLAVNHAMHALAQMTAQSAAVHAPAARAHAGAHAGAVAHTGAVVSVKSSLKRTGTRGR